MRSFDAFVKEKNLMSLYAEVAHLISQTGRNPWEFILEWSRQYPEIEVAILEEINRREILEQSFWSGLGGAISNFFKGGAQRLAQGYQTGKIEGTFDAAFKALQQLSKLMPHDGNLAKIHKYLSDMKAKLQQQQQQQQPQQQQPQQQQPQQQQPQQQQPQQQQQAGQQPPSNWSEFNKQQWLQRQQEIERMRKAAQLV